MLNMMRSPVIAEWVSASAVVLVSAIVGDHARTGMNSVQWAGGAAAMLAAISWAVMVRVWKDPVVE